MAPQHRADQEFPRKQNILERYKWRFPSIILLYSFSGGIVNIAGFFPLIFIKIKTESDKEALKKAIILPVFLLQS